MLDVDTLHRDLKIQAGDRFRPTWFVDHVMDPALALLDAQVAPLRFGHQMSLGDQLGDVFGKHDVPARKAGEEEKEEEVNKHQFNLQNLAGGVKEEERQSPPKE